MTLDCGLNRWVASKDVQSGDGPTEEIAYQNATQMADRVISLLRLYYRDDCPPDCDGGRLVKWSLSIREPYTWPGWKDDEPWWFAAVELSYDVAILCLTQKARDALRLTAASEADHYRMDPYSPQDAFVEGGERPCESALRLSFTVDFQDIAFAKTIDESDRRVKAALRKRVQEMLTTWAMRFRCAGPCVKVLLLDNNEPEVIARSFNPDSSIAKVEPAASLFCLSASGDLGPTMRKRLIDGRFIDAPTAAIFWPSDN